MRALADEEIEEIERRTPQDWRAAEAATMAAVRRAAPRARRNPWRWALGIAASLVVLALAMPWRPKTETAAETAAAAATSEDGTGLSPADRDDDALLREAAFLARGGDESSDLAIEESL